MRAAIASRVVSTVLSRYFAILETNSASQAYLCQVGLGFISSGASLRSIHLSPLSKVDQWFQTSALLAESWPPLANDVSIAA